MASSKSLFVPRIAASHYHVFHVIPSVVAKEMMFFAEAGLPDVEIFTGGLVPAVAENMALGASVRERGIDFIVDAKPIPIMLAAQRGEDLCIVGCWRNDNEYQLFSKREIKTIEDLKGKRIGVRDFDNLFVSFFKPYLKERGYDPDKDFTWVRKAGLTMALDALQSDRVDAASINYLDNKELASHGYNLLLDVRNVIGTEGRPDRVIAARTSFVDEHPEMVKAFMKGLIRAFWFMRDGRNYTYMNALERRLRLQSGSPEEINRPLAFASSIERMENNIFPIDGLPSLKGLERIEKEGRLMGDLKGEFSLNSILRLEPAKEAFKELQEDPKMQDELERMRALVKKYGK